MKRRPLAKLISKVRYIFHYEIVLKFKKMFLCLCYFDLLIVLPLCSSTINILIQIQRV
jgi:hypothetical protein